jgi:hypothetical protein
METTTTGANSHADARLIAYLNLKLREIDQPGIAVTRPDGLEPLVDHFLALSREKDRALPELLCPVDQRIQDFLDHHLRAAGTVPRLPTTTLVLDRPHLARILSLPRTPTAMSATFSPRIACNRECCTIRAAIAAPRRAFFMSRRWASPYPTTKSAVPPAVFARLLAHALNPPRELLRLPFTATSSAPAECFVSSHLRPIVCPAVPGFTPERRMETRFFVPGALVANLDFIERIFGNAGDPHLPENDAALDARGLERPHGLRHSRHRT